MQFIALKMNGNELEKSENCRLVTLHATAKIIIALEISSFVLTKYVL